MCDERWVIAGICQPRLRGVAPADRADRDPLLRVRAIPPSPRTSSHRILSFRECGHGSRPRRWSAFHRPPARGGVTCGTTSTTRRAFEVMSKRRRGYPERSPGQAGPQGRPRRQGALREARPQRPVPVRSRAPVQALLPQDGMLSTGSSGTTTSDKYDLMTGPPRG